MEVVSAAAASTAAKNVVEFKLESPYRYAASLAAISLMVAFHESDRPLSIISHGLAALKFANMSEWFHGADEWSQAVLPGIAPAFALVAVMAVPAVILGRGSVGDSRAAATLWLMLFALASAPASDLRGLWPMMGVFLIVGLVRRAIRERNGLSGLGTGVAVLIFELAIAAGYLPLSFLLWALSAAQAVKK
jgi:hypothetical protein